MEEGFVNKTTRLQIMQIMTACWDQKTISKEKLYGQVSTDMSSKKFEKLLKLMSKKHYIYQEEDGYQAIVPREKFSYVIDNVDSVTPDGEPKIILPPNGNMSNGGRIY